MKLKKFEIEVNNFAERVVERAQRNIGATRNVKGKKRRIDSSGDLRKSLFYDLKKGSNRWSLNFGGADYAGFVEYGRRPGKQPPINAILKWMKVKPIRLRDESGSFTTVTESKLKSAAYLIARKIGREGTAETRFYNEAFRDEFRQADKKLMEAMIDDLEINIVL